MNTPTCKHCGAALPASAEKIAGELVIRCSECNALNVVVIGFYVLGLL
jgi:ribosomal protein L40E